WCSSGRDSSRVVLAFTSFFFFCMSSAVNVTILPDFVPVSPLVVVVVVVSVVSIGLVFWQRWDIVDPFLDVYEMRE
nr:hypothetical protein [Tanacetum cinerariifolium]